MSEEKKDAPEAPEGPPFITLVITKTLNPEGENVSLGLQTSGVQPPGPGELYGMLIQAMETMFRQNIMGAMNPGLVQPSDGEVARFGKHGIKLEP